VNVPIIAQHLFLPAFLLAISIVFKTLWHESFSLNYQYHLSSKFTSLASNPATNRFELATLVHCSLHNAEPQYLSSVLHPYTPWCQLRSAFLHLPFSISSPNLVSSLLLTLLVFDMLALLFLIPPSSLILRGTLASLLMSAHVTAVL